MYRQIGCVCGGGGGVLCWLLCFVVDLPYIQCCVPESAATKQHSFTKDSTRNGLHRPPVTT